MALVRNGALATDTVGAEETLTLSVVQAVADDGSGAGTAVTAQIASAFYGADPDGGPIAAAVSSDGQSVTVKTLQGVHSLTVNVVSPDSQSATVQLTQNGTVLTEATLDAHTAAPMLLIEGL